MSLRIVEAQRQGDLGPLALLERPAWLSVHKNVIWEGVGEDDVVLDVGPRLHGCRRDGAGTENQDWDDKSGKQQRAHV